MFVLFFFSLSIFSWSNVLLDEVSSVERKEFSPKIVCEKIFNNDFPLVEITSGTQLDCMGTLVDVATFCDKEMIKEPFYIRAYIDQVRGKIICQTGKRVLFKYQCVKLSDRKICNDQPKKACENFQKKLAKNLDLIHFSQLKNEKGISQVNCYYEASSSEGNNLKL